MADWRDYPEFQMFEKQITSWKFEFLLCPNLPDVDYFSTEKQGKNQMQRPSFGDAPSHEG